MPEAIDNSPFEPTPAVADHPAPTGSLLLKLPQQILSVARFEFHRTCTPPRIAVWAALMIFPVVLVMLVQVYGGFREPFAWGVMLYVLVPQVTCQLALLLWVAPNVNSELEGRTWFYLTARPGGRIALLLGKHVNGVLWTLAAGWIAASLSVLTAAYFDNLVGLETLNIDRVTGAPWPGDLADPFRHWWVLMLLVAMSSLAYGSLYTLIATILPRRAMMICVAYVLVGEVFLGNMRAVINELSVHHHLVNILANCLNWHVNPQNPLTLDDTALWIHLAALGSYTLALLVVAVLILRWREYITSDQS